MFAPQNQPMPIPMSIFRQLGKSMAGNYMDRQAVVKGSTRGSNPA